MKMTSPINPHPTPKGWPSCWPTDGRARFRHLTDGRVVALHPQRTPQVYDEATKQWTPLK